jgi:hypothetical protein
MSAEIETSVAQVGLRDFLFYVVPGTVLLTGLFALEGVSASDLEPYLDISSSIAAILAAYILGQCAYPLSYAVRMIVGKIGPRMPSGEEDEGFMRAYRQVAKEDSSYFAVEVFRYRTMARFCSVMVFPVFFAAFGIALGGWQLDATHRIVFIGMAFLISFGFLWRYHRYEYRYRSALPVSRDVSSSH